MNMRKNNSNTGAFGADEGNLKELLNDAQIARGLEVMQEYMEMQQLYNSAIKEITTKLEILDSEFKIRYDHNPIHHIESRQKELSSIIEKLKRKNLPISLDSIQNGLNDVAGVRVICNYIDDIYTIADMLTSQQDIELIKTQDYICSPKPNGYRSLHLVVKVPVFLSAGPVSVPVEIQIRTIAMDFWASLEHQLRYKAEKDVPLTLRAKLNACAEASAKLDQQMQEIYYQLHDTSRLKA